MCGDDWSVAWSAMWPAGAPPRLRGRRAPVSRCRRRSRSTPACAGTTWWSTCPRGAPREHPRVCGDDVEESTHDQPGLGAPPRVRGRRVGWRRMGRGVGSTPACAGTTCRRWTWASSCTEHPRVCGDDDARRHATAQYPGAPPRVRGRRVGVRPADRGGGSTPACAGTTGTLWRAESPIREHPRVCGDDLGGVTIMRRDPGAPPRVRGRPRPRRSRNRGPRSTPACAGTTPTPCRPAAMEGEHPRVCGDDSSTLAVLRRDRGAPPRVRGRPQHRASDARLRGSTPACAGTTRDVTSPPARLWEHPRVCGDDVSEEDAAKLRKGAPPRVRGRPAGAVRWAAAVREHPRVCGDDDRGRTVSQLRGGAPPRVRGRHRLKRRVGLPQGSTPACAGTTPPCRSASCWTPEHPRVCGDDDYNDVAARIVEGAPPRVRGRLVQAPRVLAEDRSTPACAGTTTRGAARRRSRGEHPRVCGDDRINSPSRATHPGAPPRVRGRHPVPRGGRSRPRSTPACAGTTRSRSKAGSSRSEHPRVCGDDLAEAITAAVDVGAPPRVRGRPAGGQPPQDAGGSTPACAGTTRSGGECPVAPPEHPRVCGDDGGPEYNRVSPYGAPPRVRGRPPGGQPQLTGGGSTPACAGTTSAWSRAATPAVEHPRVCGDDVRVAAQTRRISGAPPRVRGRLQRVEGDPPADRSTPACAGTTGRARCKGRALGEHPRVCGDDRDSTVTVPDRTGAPPRVRGRLDRMLHRHPGERSTPACAGTTAPGSSRPRRRWEHPRVCGDDAVTPSQARATTGAPPRVRGRQPRGPDGSPARRSTPACAGTTALRSGRRWRTGEHPRVCGDDSRTIALPFTPGGAPPRVRGRRHRLLDATGLRWSTPACAGTTPSGSSPTATGWEHPRVCGDDTAA